VNVGEGGVSVYLGLPGGMEAVWGPGVVKWRSGSRVPCTIFRDCVVGVAISCLLPVILFSGGGGLGVIRFIRPESDRGVLVCSKGPVRNGCEGNQWGILLRLVSPSE